jgi:eukaryotic-like serine/threonine-protein kinase
MRLSTGDRLGTYEILAPIGMGGMGEVYRARDIRLKREVAIKILSGAWTDIDRLVRFQREAELLAALTHPNIAVIYGVEEADGVKALVLELVEGPTLADRFVQGPLPVREALTIGRQIVDALDAAHEKGIVHRDLKPANIKVRDDGTVKVLDFGLAKALEPEAAPTTDASSSPTMTSPAMTGIGVLLGTAAYMSPEQSRAQVVDKRTDIWAFGCVLYEMLTGRGAFVRQTVPDTIAAILEREPDWSALPSHTPPRVRQLVRRCLEKDRKQRLRDVGDARFELDESVNDAIAGPRGAAPRRWRYALAGTALLAIAALAVLLATWSRSSRAAMGSALGVQVLRVTTDDSFSAEPALSNDGSLVVYASDRAGKGQLDLWLQRTTGGQPIRLTDDPADDRQPSFSPDGRLIAFRSDRGSGGIYVMPVLGGDALLVAEGGRRPQFSPDGRRIAYWTGPWLSGAGARAAGSSVFVVPATGGQPTQVGAGFSTARDPVWSPDGRGILFFGRRQATGSPDSLFDWWWAPSQGGEPVSSGAYRVLSAAGLLNNQAAIVAGSEPVPGTWTSAGVFFSAPLGDGVNLWRLAVSERSGHADETSLERLTHGSGSDRVPSVSGRGRVVFQVTSEATVSLTLPLDSNAGRSSGAIQRHSYEASLSNSRNSLDDAGRLLVYPKFRGNEGEIWLKDLITGQERHLVTAPSLQLNPVISHDGTKVAYTFSNGGQVQGLIVPTAGGTARKVCDGCSLQGWFADNRRILSLDGFGEAVGGAAGRIQALDVVAGNSMDLIRDQGATLGRADVSPDGRWLSFSTRRYVWIAPLRPGNPPPQTEWTSVFTVAEGSAERACGWSPDSRLLYLLLERDGFRDLYAQRIDSVRGRPIGEPFIVQHLHDPRRRWGSTPYGTAIVENAFVFHQVESTGSIWLLDPPALR